MSFKLSKGLLYEQKVHSTLLNYAKNKTIKVLPNVGGNTSGNDIQVMKDTLTTGIEVKSGHVPSWGQFTIHWDPNMLKWNVKKHTSPHPKELIQYLNQLCMGITIWNDQPLKFSNKWTYYDWELVKQEFPEQTFTLPSPDIIGLHHDYIPMYYTTKKNSYIQIKKYGLFHFNDLYNVGTPLFTCNTNLRIRFKYYGRKCKLTGKSIPSGIVASFRPLSLDIISKYSLDQSDTIPYTL